MPGNFTAIAIEVDLLAQVSQVNDSMRIPNISNAFCAATVQNNQIIILIKNKNKKQQKKKMWKNVKNELGPI